MVGDGVVMLERVTGRRFNTLAVAGLASLTLVACGSKPPKVTNKITACPAGYTVGEKPLSNVPVADEALQAGVAQLRDALGINVYNNLPVSDVKARYLGALDSVFGQTFVDGVGEAFQVGQSTKVDGIGEAFCHGSSVNQVYYSPV